MDGRTNDWAYWRKVSVHARCVPGIPVYPNYGKWMPSSLDIPYENQHTPGYSSCSQHQGHGMERRSRWLGGRQDLWTYTTSGPTDERWGRWRGATFTFVLRRGWNIFLRHLRTTSTAVLQRVSYLVCTSSTTLPANKIGNRNNLQTVRVVCLLSIEYG